MPSVSLPLGTITRRRIEECDAGAHSGQKAPVSASSDEPDLDIDRGRQPELFAS